MMLFHAWHDRAHWITLVVRATNEDEALNLAVAAFHQYTDTTAESVELEPIDPDGPAAVVVEDAS